MNAEILLTIVFGGGALYLAGRRPKNAELSKNVFAALAVLLFLSGLSLRLALGVSSDGFSTDMDTFKAWGDLLNRVGFSQMYEQDVYLDYPPGYLYVLALLDRIRRVLGLDFSSPAYTLLLKLPAIFGDLFCAGAVLLIGERKLGGKMALFLSGAYLFCPAVFVNSAQWGQVDSVTTAILLCSVLLLYRERYLPSALLYGLSIACKPQMLIFAPLYLFFAIRQRRWGKLCLGIVCAVGVILLTALPFSDGLDFRWLIEKYISTMDYYSYYSVNAYNLWTALGWNWRALPEGFPRQLLTLAAPLLATALCGWLLLGSKRKDALFAAPVLLMTVVYVLGVKMHERYLYPVFLFLLLGFLFAPDKRFVRAFGLSAALNYLNVSYVLCLFRENGGNYDPNTPLIRAISLVQTAALGYALYVLWAVYLKGEIKEGVPGVPRTWERPALPDSRFTRWDVLAVLGVTLLYGAVAFWNLGGHSMALTSWTPMTGESVTLQTSAPCEALCYLPGIAGTEDQRSKAGVNVLVEISEDGEIWEEAGNLEDSGTYVFAWARIRFSSPASYVRLTAQDSSVVLNEIGMKLSGQSSFAQVTGSAGAAALLDEQDTVPLYTTYENSSYFDEIYHARTAYEHILGLEPYENTHPPLGKLIISLGIRMFGMNPFGWRFMGTLFGVLMLPVLYHLLKQLFGKTSLCLCGVLWFAFDFMHFTQTRIATIDTYAVFFLLLMYDAMTVFLRRDILQDKLSKLLPPLFACGIFTGLGIASKWTAAYGALGLAVLFFGKLFLTLRDVKKAGGEDVPLWRGRALTLCLWCCLFFLAIPFAIYFAAFLPITTLPHNASDVWGRFWSYQTTMFNYHSQLQAEHYFASPWYEWPLDVRPIWYFSGDPVNAQGQYSTISALGNPLLWWAGLLALLGAAILWKRERRLWAGVALGGFLSVYLPWTLVPRLTFIYHYFTAIPFLVLALCGVFCRLPQSRLGGRRLDLSVLIPPGHRRELEGGPPSVAVHSLLLWGFTAGVLLLFILYFPVISGCPTSQSYTDALRLFPTWYF